MMKDIDINTAKKYREDLLTFGQRVPLENPDRLNEDQMKALLAEIFRQLDLIDQSFGFPAYDTGLRRPNSITEEEQNELFMEFVDWYQLIPTPSGNVLKYVTQNYSSNEYHKILCVGDGENCHLGRKLAMRGYNVISIDPLAKIEYSTIRSRTRKQGEGKLHVVKGTFFENSSDMIEWADVIVGSKVPLCAESLIEQRKPAIFTISDNVEIYEMRFKGQEIHSSKQLVEAIRRCPGVKIKRRNDSSEEPGSLLFICNEKQKSKNQSGEVR